jgi:pyruvate,water dikinase
LQRNVLFGELAGVGVRRSNHERDRTRCKPRRDARHAATSYCYNAAMWVETFEASATAKARGLGRLRAAGLAVPPGFVIGAHAFAEVSGLTHDHDVSTLGPALDAAAQRIAALEIAAERVAEVEAALDTLACERFAVRSSAALEDGADTSGAGVFASWTEVARADVWRAVRGVWTSALTPLAAAYARRAGARTVPAIAVIIQRSVPGDRTTLYTRPPGAPEHDEVWIQRGDRRDIEPRANWPDAAIIERAIEAPRGADVELVGEWLVQARPIVHPPAPVELHEPPAALLAVLGDGRSWRWDIAHNPDPLSPAQRGLVELVERAGVAPWSMRVCAGYLYTTAANPSSEHTEDVDEIERKLEATLAQPNGLEDALARYVAFYETWARKLAPIAARAKRASGARRSAVEVVLAAAAAGELDEVAALRVLGPLAPAWDVAAPTFAERPWLVSAAIARTPPARRPPPSFADIAERDDWWFARAQAMVRTAILTRARELEIAEGDACWIALDDLIAGCSPQHAIRVAAAERAAAERATRWAMPRCVPREPHAVAETLRGVGVGASATGRVVRYASLAGAIAANRGDVIVARSITPALAVLVVGCAAIVCETGGVLDHGAAMARELGIPCIVGCGDAWTQLRDGMIVTVDGNRGEVRIVAA